MKKTIQLSRRTLLRSGALIFGASLTDFKTLQAFSPNYLKTPALLPGELTAIEAALGKKGTYKEAEATHNIGLPRNDLKITVKGEAVPIALGFGGWVAIKKTMDGKSAVLMSDCALLEEEIKPLITASPSVLVRVKVPPDQIKPEKSRRKTEREPNNVPFNSVLIGLLISNSGGTDNIRFNFQILL